MATLNGKVILPTKCAYPDCVDTSLRRARGYCREHFVKMFIDPQTKQEKELLSALDILQTNKKRFMAEMSEAFEQEHPGFRLICHKCGGFSVKGYMALQQHQLYCTGKKKKGPSKPRQAKSQESTDYDEEMTDDEDS